MPFKIKSSTSSSILMVAWTIKIKDFCEGLILIRLDIIYTKIHTVFTYTRIRFQYICQYSLHMEDIIYTQQGTAKWKMGWRQCVFSLQVAQTRPRGGPRSQIAIPAQGMIEFRDALTDLLDEFGTDDHGESNAGTCN